MKKLILLTYFLLCINYASAQNALSFDGIINPNNFFVVSDSVLLIYDKSRKGEELCLTNIYSYTIDNCSRIGKGPGEFSGGAVHFLIDKKDDLILMWDYGAQRLTKFNSRLEYLESLKTSNRVRGALAILPFNDVYQVYLRMNEESFAEIVNIEKDSVFKTIDNDYEELRPTKDNFLLKQGNYSYSSQDSAIIFISKYSSIVIKLSIEGIDFVTLGKPEIPFPYRDKNDEYGMPSIHQYTTSSIDVSVDDDKIYILHSGKETTYRQAFWYLVRGRILELQEKLETGTELLIYSLEKGNYIKNIRLPFETVKAKVFNDKVYALHESDNGMVISIIPIVELHE